MYNLSKIKMHEAKGTWICVYNLNITTKKRKGRIWKYVLAEMFWKGPKLSLCDYMYVSSSVFLEMLAKILFETNKREDDLN